MRISVFGLGYVGCVSSACLAAQGFEVIGVDVQQKKVDMISAGQSPIVEPRMEDLISKAARQRLLRATTDPRRAVMDSDISFVCVGTPGKSNGSLDLTFLKRVCQKIGAALESKKGYHIVAIRSTLLPGTVEEVLIPTLEVYSSKREGRDFGVAVNPEFLREASAVDDFNNPPFTLIGSNTEDAAGPLSVLYKNLKAPVIKTRIREAEAVKYASNCFHALKVTFANEFGNICKRLGADSHEVMDILCKDTKLSLSPYYLKPGFAFGGSCLPKDLRAILYRAKEVDVEAPVLNSVLVSNRRQLDRAIDLVLETGLRSVGVLGLSFKAGTDDLRESPMVTMVETLIGKGLSLSIYDKEVELAKIFGANKEYIEREIPHISRLLKPSLDEVIKGSEVLVIGKFQSEFVDLRERVGDDQVVIDLVRLPGRNGRRSYEGLAR